MFLNLKNIDNKPNFFTNYKEIEINLVPEIIAALLLGYLKQITEEIVDKVNGCVITVPAHFTNTEREATLFAAELAGLKVLQLLNEPSAAAISYGFEKGINGFILVFDFGGGTLDISIVNIKINKFDVVGYGGDQILGGRDIDNAILEFCLLTFENEFDVVHNSPKKKAILLEKCELAKILFSEQRKKKVEIFDWNENKSVVLTKAKFEELCKPIFERSIETMQKVLKKVNMNKNDIKEIVMTGGSSHIPLVQDMVYQYFGRKPRCHDPEAAIAKGAAIVAFNYKDNLNLEFFDQIRYPIGIDVINFKVDGGPSLFSKIIESCTKVPCCFTKKYFTVYDFQTNMIRRVAEGESEYFYGNSSIDEFELHDLPPKKAGEVKVEVTIKIDINGIFYVTAKEMSTNFIKGKEMKRCGIYYKVNERQNIKDLFHSIF
jgi:molecular chaperone DnaK (HSP70)